MQNLNLKRVKYEYANLEENLDMLPPNVQVKMNPNNKYFYEVQVVGEKGNCLEGSFIVCEIQLGDSFPTKPPQVTFRHDFRHINIYLGGKLCMYLINELHWVTNVTILDIILGLNQVLHKPTPDDPANAELKDMYKRSPQEYENYMIEQSKRYRDVKYKLPGTQ